jgi:hypothetical protein
MERSTFETSTSRLGRIWIFENASRFGAQRQIVVDSRGEVAEVRGRKRLFVDGGILRPSRSAAKRDRS